MKNALLSLSFILLGMMAWGQVAFEVGLKAGANFANADISETDTDAITSYHGGIYTLIKLTNVGIQPEALISSQGAELPNSDDIDLSYLNIPVMVKFYLPAGVNLQLGPQFGILTEAEDSEGNDLTDALKSSDVSAAFGAGWDAPFGLQVSARYVLGLTDISDDPLRFDEFKNKTFQFAIGYSILNLGN